MCTLYLFVVRFRYVLEIMGCKLYERLNLEPRHLLQNKPVIYR